MLLRMYKVDYDGYAPAKKKHWADGAYKIAADRNFPLDGLKNPAARDELITRQKIAEIIVAAVGLNYIGTNAVWYMITTDYVRGITERSLEGFKGENVITRADAAELLRYLEPQVKELRGRPIGLSPGETLPRLPKKEVYVKPDKLEDYMLVAEFHADHSLTIERKFQPFAGKQMTIRVQSGGSTPKHIEEVNVTLNSNGVFKITSPDPYDQESLNLYFQTVEVSYWIDVNYNSINSSKYR